MAASRSRRTGTKNTPRKYEAASDAVSWLCAMALIGLILMAAMGDSESSTPTAQSSPSPWETSTTFEEPMIRGGQLLDRPCEDIYVVGEGETLHTISDKCGDPFIVERNPHIHDPDDVFPGLIIRIVPSHHRTRASSKPSSGQ